MSITYTIATAYRSLRANKVRSGLTVLGIVIGITSIIVIVAVGEGAKGLILGQIEGLGAETVVIRPGREPKGPTDFPQTIFADSLKQREVDAIMRRENVPDVAKVAPIVVVSEVVSYGDETYSPTIFGWSAEFMLSIANIELQGGTIFDDHDIGENAAVAVIGSKVAEELFGTEDPLGRSIRIKGKNFRVVGVLEKKGAGTFFNSDEMIVVPHTTAMLYLTGTDHYFEVMVRATSAEAVPNVVEDITRTLRELHNITDPEKDDFFVVTQQGVIDQVKTILTALTAFLSAVVAISLIVGGIGVMNVLLVSVTERTREIGLRKALGARYRDILAQFLTESVLLTLLGGVIGVVFGALIGLLLAIGLSKGLGLNWAYAFPYKAAAIGLAVSAGVGLVFGIYPAQKAAKKSPIEALRYE